MCNNKIDSVTRLALIDLAGSRKQDIYYILHKCSYTSDKCLLLYWTYVCKVKALTL